MKKQQIVTMFVIFFSLLICCSACAVEEKEDPIQIYKTHITEILEEEGSLIAENKKSLKGDLAEGSIPSGLIYAKIISEDTDKPSLLMGWMREGEDELPTQMYISMNKTTKAGTRETSHITENTFYSDSDNYSVNVHFRNTETDSYIIWNSTHAVDGKTTYRKKVYRIKGNKLKLVLNISIVNTDTNGYNTNIYSIDGTPLDENVVIPKDSNKKDVKDIKTQIIQAQADCTNVLRERLTEFGLEDTIDENGYPIYEEEKDDLIVTMNKEEGKYKITTYSRPDTLLKEEE